MPYAVGRKAIGICDRCGFEYLLKRLYPQIKDLKKTGFLVCENCLDEDQPQLQLGSLRIGGPQAIKDPRPDAGTAASRFLESYEFVGSLQGWGIDTVLGNAASTISKDKDADLATFDSSIVQSPYFGKGISVPSSAAYSIGIENPGFEADVLGTPGDFINSVTSWTVSTSPGIGTFRIYDNGNQYPDPPGVPCGLNIAYLNTGSLSQMLTTNLATNTQYTLRVYVGRRDDSPPPDADIHYEVNLNAGGVTLASESSLTPARGTFLQSVIVFTTGIDHAQVGQPLEIEFVHTSGIQVNFDDVRLEALDLNIPVSLELDTSKYSTVTMSVARTKDSATDMQWAGYAVATISGDDTNVVKSISEPSLDITPTGYTFSTSTPSTGWEMLNGRGIYITANNTFEVASIGWKGDIVVAGDYLMQIKEGIGRNTIGAGATLLSQEISLPISPYGFVDVPLNFTFDSGSEYIVVLRKSDGSNNWSTGFDFISLYSSLTDSDLGDLTLNGGRYGSSEEGKESISAGVTHYRMSIVPSNPSNYNELIWDMSTPDSGTWSGIVTNLSFILWSFSVTPVSSYELSIDYIKFS